MRHLAWTAVAAMLVLGGCGSTPTQPARAREYPASTARGEVVDIQVFRDGRDLRATNTTTRTFGPSVVWINKRYGQEISGWAPGQSIALDLNTFTDEFAEPFRGGGFFARETPDNVVLVQLETDGPAGREMVGLITVGGKGMP